MVKKSTKGELEKRRARRLLTSTTFQKLFASRSESYLREQLSETARAMKKLKRATKLRPTLNVNVNNADHFYDNPVSIISFTKKELKAELLVSFRDALFTAFWDRETVQTDDGKTITGFGASPSAALWDLAHRTRGQKLTVLRAGEGKRGTRKIYKRRVSVPRELVVDGWITRG